MRHMRLMTEGATDVKGIVAKVSAEIVAATPSIVRGGLRVAKNGVNVLDDVAVACYAGGISGGVAILVCAIEVGSALKRGNNKQSIQREELPDHSGQLDELWIPSDWGSDWYYCRRSNRFSSWSRGQLHFKKNCCDRL